MNLVVTEKWLDGTKGGHMPNFVLTKAVITSDGVEYNDGFEIVASRDAITALCDFVRYDLYPAGDGDDDEEEKQKAAITKMVRLDTDGETLLLTHQDSDGAGNPAEYVVTPIDTEKYNYASLRDDLRGRVMKSDLLELLDLAVKMGVLVWDEKKKQFVAPSR